MVINILFTVEVNEAVRMSVCGWPAVSLRAHK